MSGRRGRRSKQLLNGLKEKKGYMKFKEEAVDFCVWRTRFGRSYGPVTRQTTDCIIIFPTPHMPSYQIERECGVGVNYFTLLNPFIHK